jgi:hypothetical protein
MNNNGKPANVIDVTQKTMSGTRMRPQALVEFPKNIEVA